jgi:flagellum-specific ATP synthase
MPQCNSEAEQNLILNARGQLAIYEDMAELIRLGAYRPGSNPEVDRAIALYPQFETFLSQRKEERSSLEVGYVNLSKILDGSAMKGSGR